MVWTAKPQGQKDLKARKEMLCRLLVRCDQSLNDFSFLCCFSRYHLQCEDERVVVCVGGERRGD